MNQNRASWQDTLTFYKKIFTAIDEDVNGYLSDKEFKKFLISCDIQMDQQTFNEIYEVCNETGRGKLKGKFLFDDFVSFMENYRQKLKAEQLNRISIYVTGEPDSPTTPEEAEFEQLFNEIDADKSGTISFRELMIFCKNKGLRLGYGEILAFMKYFDKDGDGELKFEEVKNMVEKPSDQLFVPGMAFVPDAPSLSQALPSFGPKQKRSEKDRKVKKNFADVRKSMMTLLKPRFENELNSDDVENMRWATFAGFRRQVNRETVMRGKSNIVQDVLPGRYNLQDMVCFNDLPPLKPKYIEVKNVTWVSGRNRKPGMIFFPDEFDSYLDVEFATNELLDYYGCSIANTRKDDMVVMEMRHAIQDFTYSDNYLEKYVLAPRSLNGNGGAGIERHDFHHLDCPLNVDNGFFILAKFIDDDDKESTLHITAFRIPVRHTLYLPAGVIHSNDYLKGTWRTMVSDVTPIDYVHLTKKEENFHFKFNKF